MRVVCVFASGYRFGIFFIIFILVNLTMYVVAHVPISILLHRSETDITHILYILFRFLCIRMI